MSTSSILRGITNADVKSVVRKAMSKGWVLGEVTGTTHYHLIWPPTGERVGFGSTVSDRNYYKSFARQLEKISGVEILPKHKHGKSKTNNLATLHGFHHTYVPPSQVESSKRIEEITKEYRVLVLEFRVISMADASRTDIQRAFEIIRRMAEIERVLKELHQPVPEHDLPLPAELNKELSQ